jgi:hypothetical protein
MRKGILLAALAGALLVPATASANTYFNGNVLTFPEFNPNPNSTYPSQLTVSGEVGLVRKVDVIFNAFSSNDPFGAEAVLVGPSGQKVQLMNDNCGGTAVDAATFLFSDGAASTLPNPCNGKSGIYKPSGTPLASLPSPAPTGPYGTALSAFNNTSANGTWSLFTRDELFGGDQPQLLAGWILQIESAPLVVCGKTANHSAEAARKKKKKKRNPCTPPKKKKKKRK